MKIKKYEITQELANKYLIYDKNSGILYRKYKYHNNVIAGKRACRNSNHSYQDHLVVHLCGHDYPAHRIIWLMNYGEFPKQHIDHIDHNEKNNLLSNLREVSQKQNNRNMPLKSNNTSGVMGVWISKNSKKKYIAEIKDLNSKKITKSFYTLEEAANQRKIWEQQFGYHENHGLKII